MLASTPLALLLPAVEVQCLLSRSFALAVSSYEKQAFVILYKMSNIYCYARKENL
jgi:hypothetical protein